jgi:ATP-dependent Lon protease
LAAQGAAMINDPSYLIADFKNIKNRVDDLKHRSDDIKSRLSIPLKRLWNPERTLRTVLPNIDFENLRLRFPQFDEVIDFYQNSVITLARLDLPFEAPPVLLQGEPGLGKTYFASELAKLLNIAFFEISMATATSSFSLSGGSIQWSEGSTGFICDTLAKSEVANPIILIDEIDKSSQEARYNPLNIFYGLLESHSAKRFRDEALEFELDASKIIWIATSNYMHNIPTPIQSRMRIFAIRQPDTTSMQAVVKSIYRHVVDNKAFGKLLDETLDDAVIENLAKQSPRAVKLAIEEGAFRAIRHHRSTIHSTDLPVFEKEKNRVGFI